MLCAVLRDCSKNITFAPNFKRIKLCTSIKNRNNDYWITFSGLKNKSFMFQLSSLNSTCRHKGLCKLRLLAVAALCLFTFCKSVAQDKINIDVDHLVGSDPADIINTDNSNRVTPRSEEARKKTFLLFNVGARKFFNIGGSYGRHASLSTAGIYLWIYNNSNTEGTYNIRTLQNYVASTNQDNTDSYVQYVDNDALKNGVYLDQQPTDNSRSCGWKFEQADGYAATSNKVYKISTYGNRYLTATPDDPDGNLCEATTDTPEKADYQKWKLITVEEYYTLFYKSPSDLTSPIGATFLLDEPNFQYNKTNAAYWLVTGENHDSHVRYGIEDFYKRRTSTSYEGDKVNDNDYLCENGKYFCADIKNSHNTLVVQYINVHKPGWYIFRCNGFSNTNGLAKIFVTNYIDYAYKGHIILASNPLNPLDDNGPKDLLEAGKAFYDGKYENQVMLHITEEDISVQDENNKKCAPLMFGIEVDGDESGTPTGEWTAFDNFRMLYASDSNQPDLVLDENNPDLSYLTETSDEYKNTVLHLNRKFTLNKWNTLILPVDLTYGQMKRTFGDDVLLAELYKITANTVEFKTVKAESDNDVMLTAFTPYIIKPTKEAGNNREYTTPRLKKAANQYWLEENEGITNEQDGQTRYVGGQLTIPANHYDISSVSLDRDKLKQYVDKHGVSTTTKVSETNDMVCKGTLVKTYYTKDKKGYFYKDENESRDNLAGAYFMKDGSMWKVPSNKQYGLLGFRCWFRLTDLTDKEATNASPAKDVTFWLDGARQGTATAIDDITVDDQFGSVAPRKALMNAVYDIKGQMVREGTSVQGLPSGIYLVNGKKVIVK